MADAVVSIVLEGLKPLPGYIIQELKFLGGVNGQVELAKTELQFMQGYLKDADERQEGSEAIHIWVTHIRDAAYDLEDVIATFVEKVESTMKGRSVLKRYCRIFIKGVHLHQIGKEIKSITTKLSKLRLSLPSYDLRETRESGGDTSSQWQRERRLAYPHVIEPHLVGLAGGTNILAMDLIKEKRQRVLSIWGMAGLGKTTLAKQVYNHEDVKRHFDCFAWVCISQQCQGREVLEEILTKLISPTYEQRQEIAKLKKDEIAERLCITQRERKCLVVLDDIWTSDAWKSLQAGFPMNEETESRILLTTRNKQVASSADKNGFLYNPQSLTDDESWELFERIAISRMEAIDPEIHEKKKELGKKMLQHCGGLPLAITVLAGLLARKYTVDEWDKVHANFYVYIRRGTDLGPEYNGEEYEGISWLLALSYDNLPYRLKLCFLYLAHFPEDYEIPVNSLTKLWIADGLINSSSGEIMEDVSYKCLNELVGRCMVHAGEHGTSNRIKTCRLHDLMRDLCRMKAKEANFLHIVNYSAATETMEAPKGRVRRLSVFLVDEEDGVQALGRDEGDGHLRSLLCFASESLYWDTNVVRKVLQSQLNDFRYLRVLKFEGIRKCSCLEFKLPSKIGTLLNLRFLSVKGSDIRELPASLADLVSLQTLDLRVSDWIEIPNPNLFCRMEKLRHIYLTGNPVSLHTNIGNLQTIVNATIRACDLYDFAKLPNLRKLAVNLHDGEKFKRVTSIKLNHLESLSLHYFGSECVPWDVILSCPNVYKLQLRGKITEIPEDLARLKYLSKLTLYGTLHLKDKDIKTLQKLPCIRMLSFHKSIYAYGVDFPATLVFSKGGFQHLEYLSLDALDGLKEWRVEKGGMPNLCKLHIKDCQQLKEVPEGLQYITTLKEFRIKSMPQTFQSRLKEGGEDYYKIQHIRSVVVLG